MSEEIIKKYNELLSNNDKILIVSKNGCPNCDKLKELFDTLELNYGTYLYEMENDGEGKETPFKDYMKEQTRGTMFPFCYINKKYVGTYTHIERMLCTGKLKEVLEEIGLDYEEDF